MATITASSALVLLSVLAPTAADAITSNAHSVVQVTGQTAWTATQVSVAGDGDPDTANGCALTTSSPSGIKCWGYNGVGQVGVGSTANSIYDYPVNTAALSTAEGSSPAVVTSDAQALSTGNNHSCVIVNTATTTGGVQCWGYNNYGQLGNNNTTEQNSPTPVVGVGGSGFLSGVTAISATGYDDNFGFTCAVVNGGVDCWGENVQGMLGINSTDGSAHSAPLVAIPASSGVTAVSTGFLTACAVFNTGQVKCWGDNTYGAVGDGSTTERNAPVTVYSAGTTPLTGVSAIDVGLSHTTCAVVSGAAKCWGAGGQNQLGNNSTSNSSFPVQVTGLTSGVTAVSSGFENACAVVSGGVDCWGYNGNGQDGNGNTTQQTTPARVLAPGSVVGANVYLSGVAGSAYGVLSAGDQVTCVDSTATSAQTDCWGRDDNGGLGDGGSGGSRTTPRSRCTSTGPGRTCGAVSGCRSRKEAATSTLTRAQSRRPGRCAAGATTTTVSWATARPTAT